jgi:hypothetical protein
MEDTFDQCIANRVNGVTVLEPYKELARKFLQHEVIKV